MIYVLLSKEQYKKFFWPVLIGLVLWFCTPLRPAALSVAAWRMFAIFLATIVGCITQPLPIGAVSIIGFVVLTLTNVVDIDTAVAGFGNSSIWLIAMAFFISRGFIKTGLGRRIALNFVSLFGKKTLNLAYSIIGVDLVLAPATPSNTARAGGVVYPIIESLADAFHSSPDDNESRKKIGSFLVFAEYHGDIITSAMFMTAMAGNPLAQAFASDANVNISWMSWFLAALVPGIISLILIPFLIYKMYPPKIKETPNAKQWADDQLEEMGKFSTSEKIMTGIFILALISWMTGSLTNIDATTTAFVALGLLLLTGVLNWQDVLKETGAWNTLTWFSVLVMMATQLNKLGFIPWFSKLIVGSLGNMNWFLVLLLVILIYFYSHYMFASATAHVSAMYAALLGVSIAAGVPPLLAALMLGFFGNLAGSTTHYASGPAPIYFGSKYVTQGEWWKMNFVLGLVYMVIWLGIGTLWTKVIGIW